MRFDLGASGRTSENNETVLLKYEVLACLFPIEQIGILSALLQTN